MADGLRFGSGFTLVELMITISVLAILLSVAVPSYKTMLLNTQVRNAAEAFANGLHLARAEAIARNANVEFFADTDSGWIVRVQGSTSKIQQRLKSEGSANVTVTAKNSGVSVSFPVTATFNSLGGLGSNSAGATAFTQLDFTANAATKPLRVTIGTGGNTKMCDPSLAYASNPRGC